MKADPDYVDVPGEYRQSVVWIGGAWNIAYSTFNPPPSDHIVRCIEDTLAYMRCDDNQDMRMGLLARMAIAHAHFEAVHPYRDGNGRTGRLLLPLMMAAEGHAPLYMSAYIEANRTTYYDALKAAQQRLEWSEIIGFMADAVVASVEEVVATAEALTELWSTWRRRRNFRGGSASNRALDILREYPVLTIGRLAGLLEVSFSAASNAVKQLVDAGILTERTGYQQNRMFVATEVLDIINRPFGAKPISPR
jgi:Fic family protein